MCEGDSFYIDTHTVYKIVDSSKQCNIFRGGKNYLARMMHFPIHCHMNKLNAVIIYWEKVIYAYTIGTLNHKYSCRTQIFQNFFFTLPLSGLLYSLPTDTKCLEHTGPSSNRPLCVHFVWTLLSGSGEGLVLSQDLPPNLSHSEFSHYFKSHEQKTTRLPPWQCQQHQQILTIVCLCAFQPHDGLWVFDSGAWYLLEIL